MCWGLGSQFLFHAYKYLLGGGTVPEHFAESRRTVFIPSFPLPRLLTLKNYSMSRRTSSIGIVQLRLQTSHIRSLWRPSLVYHAMHTSFAEMHLSQAHDRQFFDRDHRCGSRCVRSARIRYPLDRLFCCLSQCQSLLDFLRAREHRIY